MIWVLKIFKWFFIGLVSLIILTLAGGRIYQVVSESDDLHATPPLVNLSPLTVG